MITEEIRVYISKVISRNVALERGDVSTLHAQFACHLISVATEDSVQATPDIKLHPIKVYDERRDEKKLIIGVACTKRQHMTVYCT